MLTHSPSFVRGCACVPLFLHPPPPFPIALRSRPSGVEVFMRLISIHSFIRSFITSTRPDSRKEEEEEEKLAVNRASCQKLCTRCRVRESPNEYLVVHRDRSPPSSPSSLLVVSFGQSHFTSKHAQVTREKLSIFWSRLFVQNRWRHFGHVVTSRTWWRREMTYAFCAREMERILEVCACGEQNDRPT